MGGGGKEAHGNPGRGEEVIGMKCVVGVFVDRGGVVAGVVG